MKLKSLNKTLSFSLALLLVLTLIMPVISIPVEATEQGLAAKVYYSEGQIPENYNIRGNTVSNTYSLVLFHYSGGYWCNEYDKASTTIYDKQFPTEGGAAELSAAITMKEQTFTFPLSDPEVIKALDEGGHLAVAIGSGREDVALNNYVEITQELDTRTVQLKNAVNADGTAKDIKAEVVKQNGSYVIKLKLKPIINYIPYRALNYKKDFGLNLKVYIPFVDEKFGYQTYSIYGSGSGANGARGWINVDNPYDMSGCPEGFIHPSMIKNTTGALEAGHTVNFLDGNNSIYGSHPSEGLTIGKGTFLYGGAVGLQFLYNFDLTYKVTPPEVEPHNISHFVNYYQNNVLQSTYTVYDQIGDKKKTATYTINKPVEEASLINWVADTQTHSTMPTKGTQEGQSDTVTLQSNEDLFVNWEIRTQVAGVAEASDKFTVDEWRLSKYTDSLGYSANALMVLPLGSDSGHAPTMLSPSGRYNYTLINPNGQLISSSFSPANYKYKDYLHSKALTTGTYGISHGSPMASVKETGNLNLIKYSQGFRIQAAKWLTPSTEQNGLAQYDITTATVPAAIKAGQQSYNDTLRYNVRNLDSYMHLRSVYRHISTLFGNICCCFNVPEYFSPTSGPIYQPAIYGVNSKFNTYAATPSKANFKVSPEVKTSNGLTTLKYQLTDNIKVFPEVGMLFDSDNGNSSIKWVIGDKAREINPVVWQTLEYKVYIEPVTTASGSPNSSAVAKAKGLGLGQLPIFGKGVDVFSNFSAFRAEQDLTATQKKQGLLTVKTFALDFDEVDNVKSAWGNGSYNSQKQHDILWNSLKSNLTATASSWLLIDSPNASGYGDIDYTGLEHKNKQDFIKIISNNKEVNVFTHKLIIRGGQLMGVQVQDHNNVAQTVTMSMSDLKEKEPKLYTALVEMGLYSEVDPEATVFNSFENKAGALLSEQKYADMLEIARQKAAEGLKTTDIAKVRVNEGWYSEDSTTLVIKEYISNLGVPSGGTAIQISTQVKGLETPVDKAKIGSVLGKGYLRLKIDLPVASPYAGVKQTSAFFDYTSFPDNVKSDEGNEFGKQVPTYLVANGSIADFSVIG